MNAGSEVLNYATAQMNLKDTELSTAVTQKGHTVWSLFYERFTYANSETGSRLEVTVGWRQGR